MDNLNETYQKWRKMLMHSCLLLALIVCASEILMLFVLFSFNLVSCSAPTYLIKYCLIPSSINALIIITGYILIYSRLKEKKKNYVPIISLCLLGFSLAAVHNVFPSTLCSFCIPIFITVIYAQKDMTRNITILCIVLQITAGFIAGAGERGSDPYLAFDVFVACLISLGCFLIAHVLIQYESEKKRMIQSSHAQQMHLREQLLRDSLTGLYNHSAFYMLLGDLLEQQKKNPQRLFLAVLDIDNFKKVNDTWGHEHGDRVLSALAGLLKKVCTESMIAARYGGEEFTCILQDISPEQAFCIMNLIRTRFSDLRFPETEDNRITLSCGISEYQQGMYASDFFKKADKAMYAAKETGKNNVYFPDYFPEKTPNL